MNKQNKTLGSNRVFSKDYPNCFYWEKDIKQFIKDVEVIIQSYASIPEKLKRLKERAGEELVE